MALLVKWTKGILRRVPLAPLRFPTTGFEIVPTTELLEEELFEEFKTANYYQVVGKLGFGSTSSVWLARNLQHVLPPGNIDRVLSNRKYIVDGQVLGIIVLSGCMIGWRDILC